MSDLPELCRCLVRRSSDVPPGFDWLSPREHTTFAALRFPARQRDWLLGRWTAKCAVIAHLGAAGEASPPSRVEIVAADDGAPEAFVASVPAPCRLSLSHRAGVALCAVARDGVAVGCDLERIEPHDEALAEDFFGPEELAAVRGRAGRERDLLVASIWSAKESVLKLLRQGLRLDTRSVAVRLDEDGPSAGGWSPFEVRSEGRAAPLDGWRRIAGDHVLTVVTERPSAPPGDLDGATAGEARALGAFLGEERDP